MLLRVFLAIRKFGQRMIFKLPDDDEHLSSVFYGRIWLVAGLWLFLLFLPDLFDTAPSMENANRMEGILIEANPGSRSNRIRVEGESSILSARSFTRREIGEQLERSKGGLVTVWYYDRPTIFIIPETIFIEVSINGKPIIGTWEEVRLGRKHPYKYVLAILGLMIALRYTHIILKLTKTKEESDDETS